VIIIQDEDQDRCDHEKALQFVIERQEETKEGAEIKKIDAIWLLTSSVGRLDHFFAQLNSLYKFKKWPIYLSSQDWLAALVIDRTRVNFRVDRNFVGNSIGLIPMAGSARITTKGLKWNLGKFSG
jgi:thiamine pyrophosphokinase